MVNGDARFGNLTKSSPGGSWLTRKRAEAKIFLYPFLLILFETVEVKINSRIEVAELEV